LLPDLINRMFFIKTLGKPGKHVTDMKLLDPLGEIHDVLVARWSKVQNLPFGLTINAFYEKLKGIAGIFDRLRVVFQIL